jgi:hypothetical protein
MPCRALVSAAAVKQFKFFLRDFPSTDVNSVTSVISAASRLSKHIAARGIQEFVYTPERDCGHDTRAMMRLMVVAVMLCVVVAHTPAPWMNKADPPTKRAAALLSQMTLDEKIVMLHGPMDPMPCCECDEKLGPLCNYTGNVYPNTRLGIPQIKMNDGPQGFRDGSNPGTSTAWPSAMTVVRLCG